MSTPFATRARFRTALAFAALWAVLAVVWFAVGEHPILAFGYAVLSAFFLAMALWIRHRLDGRHPPMPKDPT